jgi:hypothetical protein
MDIQGHTYTRLVFCYGLRGTEANNATKQADMNKSFIHSSSSYTGGVYSEFVICEQLPGYYIEPL